MKSVAVPLYLRFRGRPVVPVAKLGARLTSS